MTPDAPHPESETRPPACTTCGKPLPEGFRSALCPSCLLADEVTPTPTPGSPREVPSVEDLRPLLPGLEVLEFLGAGGMGAVYKARQTRLDRPVALKLLAAPSDHHEEFALRFEREARLLARLNHPHIVTVHDFGTVERSDAPGGRFHYLVMEYVDGEDLASRLRRGPVPPTEALDIAMQVCEALAYAHEEGVTHRDIKPANLLIDRRGIVKVADFGLAKLVRGDASLAADLTLSGTTLGTPPYMAPEQWEADGTIDHRADLYALGVICHEMLTGERPLGRSASTTRRSRAVRRFDLVVDRALQRDPTRRFTSALEMKAELARIGPRFQLVGKPISARFWRKGPLLAAFFLGLLITATVVARLAKDPSANRSASALLTESAPWNPAASRAAAELAFRYGCSVTVEQDGKIRQLSSLPTGDFRTLEIKFPPGGYLSSQRLTPDEVLALLGARELTSLSLQECLHALNAEVCAKLGTMPNLAVLSLQQTNLTDEWMFPLAKAPRLRELQFSGTEVTDAGLVALGEATQLEDLRVGALVSGRAIATLPTAPRLRTVSLGKPSSSRDWDEDVQAVLRGCPSLERLLITGNISPEAFAQVDNAVGLRYVKFGDFSLSREHFEALSKAPSLRELAFDIRTIVPDDAWQALATFKNLRTLQVKKANPFPSLTTTLKQFEPPLPLEVVVHP